MRRRRYISPRLASGDPREPFHHGFPPEVKEGLRAIARAENKSMAWVLEQVVVRYFKLPAPEYVTPKAPPTPTPRKRKR